MHFSKGPSRANTHKQMIRIRTDELASLHGNKEYVYSGAMLLPVKLSLSTYLSTTSALSNHHHS